MKKFLKILLVGALGGTLQAGSQATTDNKNIDIIVNAVSVAIAGAITLRNDKKNKEDE